MPQPPTLPVIAHELVRNVPALSMKSFRSVLNVGQPLRWEFDLAARTADTGQFISALAAPANSLCTVVGGAGPQVTPQPALGPWADWWVETDGNGLVEVRFAADASPCNYFPIFASLILPGNPANASLLRVTARFIMLTYIPGNNGQTTEVGFYIRNG